MADSKLRLSITTPDGATETVELEGTSFIVGTGEEASVRLEDPKVSELHARLKLKDGAVTVTDLGSDEGTTIDGEPVGKDTVLSAGASLKLGGTVLKLAGEASASASGPGVSGKGKKGGKADKSTARTQVHRVEAVSASAAAAASATDGNAARALDPAAGIDEAISELIEEEPSAKGSKKDGKKKGGAQKKGGAGKVSVLDVRPTYERDARFTDYATRFLSEELPESLKPTKDNRRLQVALVWGTDQFLDVRELAAGETLSVGSSQKADFHVYHEAVKESLALVQPQSGDEFRILLPAGASTRVSAGGQTLSTEKLVAAGRAQALEVPVKGASLLVGLEDRVTIEFGNLQVIARYTRPNRAKWRPLGERIDVNFLSTMLILLLGALAFERMVAITDFSKLNLSDDLFKNKDRFAKYIAREEVKEKPKFEQLSGVKEGAKAKDDEGKFGKKEETQKEAAPSKKGAPVVDVDKREEDRKKVMNSGLIALLGSSDGAASNVLGPGGIGTGLNNMVGGRGGTAMGDAQGVGGLGARGGGTGGGGTALGIGGLGGHGGGRGRGGSGEFDLGGKGKGTTQFVPGKTTVLGGLTADEVGRIIRRHWNEIKYCYEKELNKDPNLYGKVSVFFVIGPVGDVVEASVKETTMNSTNVEQCMVSQVRRWKFPSPRGGGVVQVNYPFIFKQQE